MAARQTPCWHGKTYFDFVPCVALDYNLLGYVTLLAEYIVRQEGRTVRIAGQNRR